MSILTANMINEAAQTKEVLRRMLTEEAVEDPFGFGEKIGETSNGHDIHHHGHENYADVVSGKGGIKNMDHFNSDDHNEAAKRHRMVAGMADEHAGMFRRMYGDKGERLPDDQREMFDSTMKQMDAMAANHSKIADAHSKAAG